jgi:hypothetical protein
MSNTILYLYSVESPKWSQVTNNHKDNLAEIITRGGWRYFDGLRRGFLNCMREEDIVYGYFAQEGRIRIEQYDDDQQPQSDEKESFERILFVLFLEAGVLAVQSTRVPRYIDLTGSDLRQSFFDMLEVAFRQANLVFSGRADFDRYKIELSREELIQIFETRDIRRVRVKELLNSRIPANFKFFNPDFDADAFLKSVIDEDLENTNEAEWSGNNIQETKIARGLVHAGTPTLIEGLDDTGYIREWTPSSPQSISLELDTENYYLPENDLRRILDLIGRSFGLFSKRLKQLDDDKTHGDLPLFGQNQE